MQATSDLYRQILSSDNHWFETKVRINGVDYGEDVLFSVSTETAMFTNDPEVGRAIAGEIDVSLLSPDETIPPMANVEPFVRIAAYMPTNPDVYIENDILVLDSVATISSNIVQFDGSATTRNDIVFFQRGYYPNYSEWLPKGVFYIDTRETTRNGNGLDILSIHGYDAMLFAEQLYPSTTHAWPMIDTAVVQEMAATMGVVVDPRTYNLMTSGYMIPLPGSYSIREVLGYIASMYVGSFIMTETGMLRLVSITELPEETNYLINNAGDTITFGGDRILV
jgi:hypothetical protein